MAATSDGGRGHRALPHTADVIVEAWGPDLPACLEETVGAFAELYADSTRARMADRRRVRLAPAPAAELLLDLLDEVIFALDTHAAVPVAAEVTARGDGGLDATIALAARDSVTPTGAVPKGISRSHLQIDEGADRVTCSVLVDV
jgi:SHS2 domain-containing protein